MIISHDTLLSLLVFLALLYLAGNVAVRLLFQRDRHVLLPGSRPRECLLMAPNPKASSIRAWHLQIERVSFRQSSKRAA